MILILASLFGDGFSLAVITSPVWIPWLALRTAARRRDERPAVKRRAF